MLAGGVLFASDGAVNVVFFAYHVCLGFCEAQARSREAFVNGGQLRCEHAALGIEHWSRWR